tara:strand:- start:43 stop:606 length:564 start_codon:yes stop_codon:yes gene_type:complete
MKYLLIIISFISIIFSNSTPYTDENNSFNKEPEYIPIYDFSLSLLNDTTNAKIKLSDFKGSLVLLNFWATWCGPCIVEIPEFNNLYNKYKDKGFEILGVSVSDSKKQLEKFQKKFDVDYKILYSTPEIMSEVNMNYGVNSVPISYLINRDSHVVRGYPSAIIGDYWTNALITDIEKFLEVSSQTPYK